VQRWFHVIKIKIAELLIAIVPLIPYGLPNLDLFR